MYLLNTFARKLGSKDKQKRKSRKDLLGAVVGTTTGIGIAKVTNKKKILSELKKQNLDTEGIKKQISREVKDHANLYKNVIASSNKFIEELNNTAPTGNLENDLRRQIKTKIENNKRTKLLGKINANSRNTTKKTLKTQATHLKDKLSKNRLIKGALLGLGTGALVGKTIDLVKYINNPNIKNK